jgi:hypothetical protein
MFKPIFSTVAASVLFLGAQLAQAQEIVFDPSNFAETLVSAEKAVQGEIYQTTNIVYQYDMMRNQLLQATNLNPGAMAAQMSTILNDISAANKYVSNSQALYGNLNNASSWISNVQSMSSASGKTPQQWLSDENTLAQNGNTAATNLFQQGSNIAQQTQQLTQRRQQLQQQLNLSQTQQSTASLTTHYLDILASQNNGLMTLAAQQAQISAQKDATDAAKNQSNISAQQTRITQQTTEFSTMNGLSN